MPLSPSIPSVEIDRERLAAHVAALVGPRHGLADYIQLEEKARYIEASLRSFSFDVVSREVPFRGQYFRNLVATLAGSGGEGPRLLIGAHYDAFLGTPGADDNASGVAVLLETARLLKDRRFGCAVEFVAFTLEEPQDPVTPFLIGSRHFARAAREQGVDYRGVLILESVGYTDLREGSQIVPLQMELPAAGRGDFLCVVADRRSTALMEDFAAAAQRCAPSLPLVPFQAQEPAWLMLEARYSDHASFWDQGYPALMLTDTALFRNPHYHQPGDTIATLDFSFMAEVTRAVAGAVPHLAGGGGAGPGAGGAS